TVVVRFVNRSELRRLLAETVADYARHIGWRVRTTMRRESIQFPAMHERTTEHRLWTQSRVPHRRQEGCGPIERDFARCVIWRVADHGAEQLRGIHPRVGERNLDSIRASAQASVGRTASRQDQTRDSSRGPQGSSGFLETLFLGGTDQPGKCEFGRS